MEISKMLTLSTAHITKETAEILGDKDNFIPVNWTDFLSIYDKGDCGWFLVDWMLSEETIPEDLRACFKLAERNGCDWLCLDCDGPVEDCLPTYEWE